MKKMKWMVIIVVALVLASFAIADAQWRGKGRWGPWAANYYHWNWNPATVETIKGEVMTKDTITPPKGRSWLPAVGMTLKKEDDYAIYVHLGPQWYFDKQELGIEIGDKVEVTGSKIMVEGNTVLLVSSLKKGDKTWQFRDQQGFPFWSGRRW
ncbi:MAG: DNA-binding protein [Deltaproteobacteria bacterium]|nr:DNA-binding protein [Deltaproteobacteria bacterium]